MKKILAIALVVVMCCGLIGCSDNKEDKIDRFAKVYKEGSQTILVDKETGVMYAYCHTGYAAGLTVMLDADGRPLIYEEDGE